MEFFVPAAEPEEVEQVYAEFARWAGRSVPPLERRIASIRFVHNGVAWTAEVGKTLSGERIETKHGKADHFTSKTPVSDPALVLAIFEGNPYVVVTSAHPLTDQGSAWVNPFFAGQPSAVRYFKQSNPNSATK